MFVISGFEWNRKKLDARVASPISREMGVSRNKEKKETERKKPTQKQGKKRNQHKNKGK